MVFPNWCLNPHHLPSLEDISSLPKTWNWSFDDFKHHNPFWMQFQVLNDEFVTSLSEQLLREISLLWQSDVTLLEVWAWNGRLAYFLNKKMLEASVKERVKLIAIDDYSRDKAQDLYIFMKKIDWIPVEEIDVIKAVDSYKPDIIISSWMPANRDWSKYFRRCCNVKHFVLIWNPEKCWTKKTWSECSDFSAKELVINWNICWEDNLDSTQKYSKIVLFSRRKY